MTTQIAREETCCHHMGYSFRLAARVLLYASSQRQDSTYHSLCYCIIFQLCHIYIISTQDLQTIGYNSVVECLHLVQLVMGSILLGGPIHRFLTTVCRMVLLKDPLQPNRKSRPESDGNGFPLSLSRSEM